MLDDAFSGAILARLNQEKLFYNQVMWVSQEPGNLIENLRGVKWPADATRALSESIDPRPVTLTGNYVGYRWHFDTDKQRKAFLKDYVDASGKASMTHSASTAIATGGVFGEAVLGQAVSAEKIDLTLLEMAGLTHSHPARTDQPTPGRRTRARCQHSDRAARRVGSEAGCTVCTPGSGGLRCSQPDDDQ
ncbi:MAG: hypothetical protein R3E89_05475 [Thiolinea sp.]